MDRETDDTYLKNKERKKMVEKIRIEYPRQTAIVEEIKQCREKSKYSREPRCMFIYGRPGVGKSTIKDIFIEKCIAEMSDKGKSNELPILSMNAPVQATTKSLVSHMLLALGDPAYEKGTKQSMSARVETMMRKKGIEIIILDEFQRFIDFRSNRVLREVAETLTIFMNNTRIPMVLIGLPMAKEVFNNEEYLARRFLLQKEITPFQWRTEADKQEFINFLAMIENSLSLGERSHLYGEEMAFDIHRATDGIAHYVMALIKESFELAIESGSERISSAFLAKVFDEQLRNVFKSRANPFMLSIKTEKDKQTGNIEQAMKEQRNGKKERNNKNIGEILRA